MPSLPSIRVMKGHHHGQVHQPQSLAAVAGTSETRLGWDGGYARGGRSQIADATRGDFRRIEHRRGAERSDREFYRLLGIALGSNAEIEAQITIAGDMGLIDPATVATMIDHTDHIGKMIRRLMQHLQPSG
jgi:four helix bundle protein